MQNVRLDAAQAGIKIAGRNINTLRYADDNTILAKIIQKLKSFLMKVKEWKSWLKSQHSSSIHGIQFHHLMENKLGNNGNSDWLYFLGVQNHCRWWLATKLIDTFPL